MLSCVLFISFLSLISLGTCFRRLSRTSSHFHTCLSRGTCPIICERLLITPLGLVLNNMLRLAESRPCPSWTCPNALISYVLFSHAHVMYN
jgi:hypothetical protein